MIFGAIIDEDMKEDIKVTVIATGFEHKAYIPTQDRRPSVSNPLPSSEPVESKPSSLRPFGTQSSSDQLDIPTFLRNRGKQSMDD